MAEQRRARCFISGRVQGVAFRDRTRSRAHELGVRGWIRNLSDGRVEAVFQGPPDEVQELVEWCKTGPERATVKNVEVEEESPRPGEMKFSVRADR